VKYTVLGASGFIGSALVTYLQGRGHEVATPKRGTTPNPHEELGHVIYAIGLTADFRKRPFDTMEAHIAVLAEWLSQGVFESFVYLSSTRLYSGASRTAETEPILVLSTSPSDLYNISKLAGESLCLNCGRDNVKVARLSNVVGAGAPSEDFLPAVVREAWNGHIHLRTAADSEKDYIYISDVISLLAAIGPSGKEKIYNVASGFNCSHQALIDILVALTSCGVSFEPNACHQAFPVIEINRIREEFSFIPLRVLDILPSVISANRP
jgi:nucleoside-diphosphate-sugar epimerase